MPFLRPILPCVVSIFGTLFAGGVFVVVNAQTKADKLAYILTDSEASFLVTEGTIAWEAHIGGFLAGLLLFPLFDPVGAAGD